VSVLALQEAELLSVENSAQVFNLLSDVPGDVQDVDELLQVQIPSTSLADIKRPNTLQYKWQFITILLQ